MGDFFASYAGKPPLPLPLRPHDSPTPSPIFGPKTSSPVKLSGASPMKQQIQRIPSPLLERMGMLAHEVQDDDGTDDDLAEGFIEDHMLVHSLVEHKKEQRIREGVENLTPVSKIQSFGFTIEEEQISEEEALAGKWVHRLCARRRKYITPKTPFDPDVEPTPEIKPATIDDPRPPKSHHVLEMKQGVIRVYNSEEDKAAEKERFCIPDVTEFIRDLRASLRTVNSAPIKSLCHSRLHLLEAKVKMHLMLNEARENQEQKRVPHRDFYNVRKVDTHVHHTSCMHQKHLLRFMRKKLKTDADKPVLIREGKVLTLTQVFESLHMTAYDLSIDTLDMHADRTLYHRFDKFNLKYNPFGQSRLREIFLKHDNHVQGAFLAELTQEVFSDLDKDKYQMMEPRISIYGRDKAEWKKLSLWVVSNNLLHRNVRWMIQVPRLAHLVISQGIVKNFEEMISNVFQPLFDVTVDPSVDPYLHTFLTNVTGFDSVDDESVSERKMLHDVIDPAIWTSGDTPVPYTYYMYFMWANICTLNHLRLERGLNTFQFRPHAGEAGDVDHLVSTFLLADGINHGITLRKSPVMEYVYYLEQVGIAMSPMSNNSLFLSLEKNPFYRFFLRGLNVSLSTDDPLQFHHTHESLIEEYAMAKQVWHLSNTDLCEIARNSVLQSGFEHAIKSFWLGKGYYKGGIEGNNIHRTNVPNLRVGLRDELLAVERCLIEDTISATSAFIHHHQSSSDAPPATGTTTDAAFSATLTRTSSSSVYCAPLPGFPTTEGLGSATKAPIRTPQSLWPDYIGKAHKTHKARLESPMMS